MSSRPFFARLHGAATGALWTVLALIVACVVAVSFFVFGASTSHQAASAAPSVTTQAARPLSVLTRSVVEIKSMWRGTVQIPATSGTLTIPVEYGGQCSALFIRTGARPVLLTSAHCVYAENVRQALLMQVYSQLGGFGSFTKLPPQSSWTLTGENIKPVSGDVEIVPTYDSVKAFGKAPVQLSVASNGTPRSADFATLQASAAIPGARALPIAPVVPAIGSPVVSVGYPGTFSKGVVGQYREASFKVGSVSSHQVLQDGGQPVTEVSSPLSQGMSGGPTLDRYGNVIGLNMMLTDSQPFNLITDTAKLRGYLSAHGVTPGKPSTSQLTFGTD